MTQHALALLPSELARSPWSDVIVAGRYDAAAIADLVDWSKADLAQYLGKSRSALSRQTASTRDQEKLGALVAVLDGILGLAGGDVDAMRAWLRTPNWAFDDDSARTLILSGRLERVRNLIEELEAGTAA